MRRQTRLASDARWELFAEGDVILDQGCTTREIFVVTRGKVRASSESVRWFFTRIRLSSQAQLEEEAGGGLVRLVGELNPDDLYGEECFLEVYHPDRPSSTPASEMFAAANICPPLL